MRKIVYQNILLLCFICFIYADNYHQQWRRVYDLRGQWRFSIGDNYIWSDPAFDDSEWIKIFAPSNWEDEGYPGYDGYAWYRKSFRIDKTQNIFVHLGIIDDADQVFINGKLVGFAGSFPPNFFTGYNIRREYYIPPKYLYTDRDNIIAVRVYDAELEGGLIRGKLGIYEKLNWPDMIKSFHGSWKFITQDDPDFSKKNYDDSKWDKIEVPLSWEAQGHDHNGYAWYRLSFKLSDRYKGERLVILLGKIDDLDETYLNGRQIGHTGSMPDTQWGMELKDSWQEIRAYPINNSDIDFNGENVLAVRVYDWLVQGGIYEGPVGIILYDEYKKWTRKEDTVEKSLFDYLKIFK